MLRAQLIVLPFFALAFLALACNGNGTPTATLGPTARPTRTAVDTPKPSPTASPEKSPPITQTPTPQVTPAATTPAARPTATPTASPIPVTIPANLGALLAPYQGQTIDWADCLYQPRTAIADCAARGRYALGPPFTGQDISCSIGIVQEKTIAIRCTSQEPLQTLYYAIP